MRFHLSRKLLQFGAACVLLGLHAPASATPVKIAPLFRGYDACFLLKEVGGEMMSHFNAARCGVRLSPASTFKIFNSLVAIEMGVAADPGHVYRWDGTPHPGFPQWERDLDMETAFRESAVWYYQRLASEIGEAPMRRYLVETGYGNRDMSGGLTRFWLGSSLQVSPAEQLHFLDRLYRNDLPFSPRTMHLVRKMMIADSGEGWTLSGKTGTVGRDGRAVAGWYVGSIQSGGKRYVFATSIRGGARPWGPGAREITRDVLRELRLLD
jgi:beta-lactamase class D